jgi:hypothetical protein
MNRLNPLPGMNPWLEEHWPDVHSRFAVYVGDALNENLPAGLRARVEENLAVSLDDSHTQYRPDVMVSEAPRIGEVDDEGSVTYAEELLVIDDPEVQRSVEIVTSKGNVVTAIEILSPTNKLGHDGRKAYSTKARAVVASGINLVEIDLIRQGQFNCYARCSLIPEKKRAPYYGCVTRANRSSEHRIYPLPLRQRLGAIPIPLRTSDEPVPLDLQAIINQCFERGLYGEEIDYTAPLDPPLSADDRAWVSSITGT